MANIYTKVGENIRKYRKKVGLTQEELAEKAKIEPRSVIEIESGNRNPTLKTLSKISQSLKIPLSNLLK